jgi:lipoprotein-anchoring transpeptidase ErfK/SrfK
MPCRFHIAVVVLVAVFAAAPAAATGDGGPTREMVAGGRTTDVAARDGCRARPATEATVGWPSARAAWRAQPLAAVRPRSRPGAPPRHAVRRLGPATAPWLLVLRAARDRRGRCWVLLRLPHRPNDADGWVRRRAVALEPTPFRIVVSRRRRTVTVYRARRVAVRARVVVGKPSTPTPGGLFGVVGAWPNPARDFSGTWILGLTAHSRALRRFDGGNGQVAIHGRGGASLADPLGSARSHGCVRVANRDLDRIVRTIGRGRLPGTPVRIR